MSAIDTVADLMVLAARTAPKAVGEDYIVIETLRQEQMQSLGEAMIAYGEREGQTNFDRDGRNVIRSQGVVLIGIKEAPALGADCSACGEPNCLLTNTYDGVFKGPQCAIRMLDLGIAIGSAVKAASMLNVDNRIMYRVGVVAREEGLIDADVVMGIPLSATGKNIFFDRG